MRAWSTEQDGKIQIPHPQRKAMLSEKLNSSEALSLEEGSVSAEQLVGGTAFCESIS
jgi:hypothetical protein